MNAEDALWFGRIPDRWSWGPLGRYFTERRETVSDQLFTPLSVTKDGIVPQLDTAAKTNDGDNRRRVAKGDFVINSRSDRRGSSGLSKLDGSVSVISTVITPRSSLSSKFVHHLLRSTQFQEEYYRYGTGIVADLWSTRYSQMKKIPIPVPPLEEQRRIAEFLDRETAQIDELIAKQEQLIATLAERFTAQVVHLAGVRTFESSGSRAPSLRRVARLATGGTPSGDEALQDEGGFPWFRPDDLDEFGRASIATRFISHDHAAGLARVASGSTLVCAIGATLGKLGFVEAECSTNQQITAVTFNDAIVPRFGYYALLAERQQILSLSVGNTLPIINNLRLGATRIAAPSKITQRQVIQQLDEHSRLLRTLTSRAERAVGLLRERRQALISAAVTGQIDVGGAS